jgi:hypothetical protein
MKYIILIALIFVLPFTSAAHYIVGQVNDASDSTTANGRTVVLWNSAVGITDNITDIVGPTGNSGTNNVYFADCEMLKTPCKIGDIVKARLFDAGDGYSSNETNVTVSGSGYDIMPNMTLIPEISFSNMSVDDSYITPPNEIDLTPAAPTVISCQGILTGSNMDSAINNVTSEFFSNTTSFYGDSNHNNRHYANTSCSLNIGYGDANQVYFNCSYNIQYYAASGGWNCIAKATKNTVTTKNMSVSTSINPLLALQLPDSITYGIIGTNNVSAEKTVDITNFGNIPINLSLQGYAKSIGDNLSMNCSGGAVGNISVYYEKYNLTTSNPSITTLSDFEKNYNNLTSTSVIRKLGLNARQSDIINDATQTTYWRMYVPVGVTGDCSGKIIFGATSSAGI